MPTVAIGDLPQSLARVLEVLRDQRQAATMPESFGVFIHSLGHGRHDIVDRCVCVGLASTSFPGNRARRAVERPLDTIHGTLDRAIVVPPMGNVGARAAATTPAPTQTATTRAALVTQDVQS